MAIFGQAPIGRLAVSEESLHDQKWVFHFCANGRFAPLYLLLPVDKALRNLLHAANPAIDAILNAAQMFVRDYFLSLFNAQIARVTINDIIIVTDEL